MFLTQTFWHLNTTIFGYFSIFRIAVLGKFGKHYRMESNGIQPLLYFVPSDVGLQIFIQMTTIRLVSHYKTNKYSFDVNLSNYSIRGKE